VGGEVSETESESCQVNEIEGILQDIGMVSPVTKYSAGKMFHQQLARQISDILIQDNRLQKLGGMITLTDLYCLVNRSRGTELVSPDDLLQAVAGMSQLGVGMSLKTYKSGVLAVQLNSLSEIALCRTILDFITQKEEQLKRDGSPCEGVFSFEVAQRLKTSLVVTKELMLIAEAQGLICRDESVNGVSFFGNRFS
jgi:ESCRT-II complex subunit VPS36